MQVSTYADWPAVSRNHAQHYGTAGKVTPGGDLADRIAGIASASDDPLTRAALALRLVQDDISYLMNGMSGGNYIPQAPEGDLGKALWRLQGQDAAAADHAARIGDRGEAGAGPQ